VRNARLKGQVRRATATTYARIMPLGNSTSSDTLAYKEHGPEEISDLLEDEITTTQRRRRL
jgi:hypothetical protein